MKRQKHHVSQIRQDPSFLEKAAELVTERHRATEGRGVQNRFNNYIRQLVAAAERPDGLLPSFYLLLK